MRGSACERPATRLQLTDVANPYAFGDGASFKTFVANVDTERQRNVGISYQDINSGYGANDMANWKVADINGVRRQSDLVRLVRRSCR